MTAAALAARLQGVRRNGSAWTALCPAHGDRNPSLSIHERSGKILLHCFAGCGPEAICSALGIRLSDLFSESVVTQPKARMVHEAERAIRSLGSRLTPRERVFPVTVVYCDSENLEAGLARALALAVEGEIVQAILEDHE